MDDITDLPICSSICVSSIEIKGSHSAFINETPPGSAMPGIPSMMSRFHVLSGDFLGKTRPLSHPMAPVNQQFRKSSLRE
jgi:hypothetical protein